MSPKEFFTDLIGMRVIYNVLAVVAIIVGSGLMVHTLSTQTESFASTVPGMLAGIAIMFVGMVRLMWELFEGIGK